MATFDAEPALLEGLAVARGQIVGEFREAKDAGLEQLRAAMRRLFAGFELCSPLARFGSGCFAASRGPRTRGTSACSSSATACC